MKRPQSLDIYYGAEIVGTLHDTSPLSFEYATTWLGRDECIPLGAVELAPGRNDSINVQAFFENLLPEGELRDYITQQKKASTLFSLLHEVAGDTAGCFVILPSGKIPGPPEYDASTWKGLAAKLAGKSAAAIDIKGAGSRISLAGAQDKTSIAISPDGEPRLPRGTTPSTHILKPDIRRLAKVWHSAANETITMLAAANCGLPTAEVFYEPHTKSCVVRRFDRIGRPDGSLGRLIQYDLCQLSGTLSDHKYEKEGGPGIAQCAELIRMNSSLPAVDLRHFLNWIFFNLYVGNNDSHAKNLSMYWIPGNGVRLTPFYDLMCTRLYPGLSPEFAFSIGGEVLPGSVNKQHVVEMARVLDFKPSFVISEGLKLAAKMPAAIDKAIKAVEPVLPPGAKLLAERLKQFVLATTKKTAQRIAD